MVINVLDCTVGGMCFLAPPIWSSLSLSPRTLYLNLAPIAYEEMLTGMCRPLHRIVSWAVAIPAYEVFDGIASPYMTHHAIHGIYLPRISDILLFHFRVPCVRIFSFSVGLVGLGNVLLSSRLLRHGGYFSPDRKYSIAYAVCRLRQLPLSLASTLSRKTV